MASTGTSLAALLAANGRLGLEPFLRGGWQAIGWIVGETLINLSTVVGTLLLVGRFAGIGLWGSVDLYFMLAFILIAQGIANVFSGRNVLMISRKIGRGQLDHALLQPLPLWKALAAEGFSPFDLLVTLIIGVSALTWTITELPQSHNVLWIGALLLNVASASAVIVFYQYVWGALGFWSPRGAEEVNTTTASISRNMAAYPLDMAPRVVIGVLVTVAPLGFIGWVPAGSLLGIGSGFGVLAAPFAALVLGIIAVLVFRTGLKRYERYGSGRYSEFGHRR